MNQNLFIHQSSIYDIFFPGTNCFEYTSCITVTYYVQTQTCLLYQEKCGLGQLVSDDAQTASVINLDYENP